jgi:hypothetical protein
MSLRVSLIAAMLIGGVWLATPARAALFFFNTGNPDGRLGALSRRPSSGKFETETADDFILSQTTSIDHATITGLIPLRTPLSDITNVEVELYHVFPKDSVEPPAGNVPARANSPADVEIGSATRDGSLGTLGFNTSLLSSSFTVSNTVVNGIIKAPNNVTKGEGSASGEDVQIAITFSTPILLPPDHYFFRPEVLVTDGDFLYLSAPKPIVAPGTPFMGDLQAWIRNSNLAPDWLRIGTDIIDDTTPPPTFNMTFFLAGNTVPAAGTPGQANCHGKSVSALAHQFGGLDGAASALGFSSVNELQETLGEFCRL